MDLTIQIDLPPALIANERTRQVAEAFEMGDLSPANPHADAVPLLRPTTLTLGAGELAYLIGASGSGKSQLLAALARGWPTDDGRRRVVFGCLADPLDRPRSAVLDLLDLPVEEALRLLCWAGLGEARLWLMPAGRLSAGQADRLALARLYAAAERMAGERLTVEDYASGAVGRREEQEQETEKKKKKIPLSPPRGEGRVRGETSRYATPHPPPAPSLRGRGISSFAGVSASNCFGATLNPLPLGEGGPLGPGEGATQERLASDQESTASRGEPSPAQPSAGLPSPKGRGLPPNPLPLGEGGPLGPGEGASQGPHALPPVLLLIDEFGSRLDRLTARILAANLRRWLARSPGVAVVVATAHDDLADALAADWVWVKTAEAELRIARGGKETPLPSEGRGQGEG